MSRQDGPPSPSPPPNSPTRGQPPADRIAPNVLTRAIQATGMTSAINSTTNGLMRALEAATRRKPSSAMISRVDQARPRDANSSITNSFDQANDLVPDFCPRYQIGFGQDASVGYHSGPAAQGSNSPHQDIYDLNDNGPGATNRQNIFDQNTDSSQQQESSRQRLADPQIDPGHHSLPGQQNISTGRTPSRLERLVRDTDTYLHQRLRTISQNLERMPGMLPDVATVLSTELYHVYEEYAAQAKRINSEYSKTEIQRDKLVGEIAKSQGVAAKYQRDSAEYRRLHHDAVVSRDRAIADRDQLKKQLNELSGKQLQLEQRLHDIEEKHAISLKSLRHELRFKEEQITAKRSLWVTAHQEPSGNIARSSSDSYVTPPRASRLPLDLPSGLAVPSVQHWGPLILSGSTPSSRAHHGSVSENDGSPQMALIPFTNDAEISGALGADFEKIYDLALKWTQNYTHELASVEADQTTSRSEELWTFMKSCTYENNREAHLHVIHLLRDSKTRPFLLMRMIIQILCRNIWTSKNFEDFDSTTKPKLDYFRERLQTRGLSPDERANIISQQADLIESMMQQQLKFVIYRNSQVEKHAKELRAKTGPLLDKGVRRYDASKGLNEIAYHAFDLSAKMFTSNRTFLIKFPECGSKFLPTSMVSRNPYDTKAPLDNQLRLARVKLAITPVVTMRDDRFMTIQVKDIQRSHVLIMI